MEYNNWVKTNPPIINTIENYYNENIDFIEEFKNGFNIEYKPKVIFWNDRKKNDYFKQQLQEAFLFENYIAEKIKFDFDLDIEPFLTSEGQYELGENALGIEIKNDKLIKKYGNIYVEYQEKADAKGYLYVDSGILKNDNTKYFLIGDYDEFFIARKSVLLNIYYEELANEKNNIPSKRGVEFKVKPTSKGIVIPVKKNADIFISFELMMNEIISEKQ